MNLAPNGKPSNLTPEQYKLVRTKAFKNWFGDWENDPKNASKVVDENGEPLLLYRGNKGNVEELGYEFNLGQNLLNKKSNNNFGFFFTDDIKVAKSYGNPLWNFKYDTALYYVLNVFIDVKNIIDLRSLGFRTIGIDFIELLDKKNISFKGYENLKQEIIKYDRTYDTIDAKEWYTPNVYDFFDVFPKLREVFKNNKINGVLFKEKSRTSKGEITYAVFNSNQIKLADGSNTTFDSNNNDIRFDKGGLIKIQPIQNELAHNYFKRNDAYGQFIAKNGNLFYIVMDISPYPKVRVFDAKTVHKNLGNGYGTNNIAIANFNVDYPNKIFSGYSENQSIFVENDYRRIGIASAITDFAEEVLGMNYVPSKLLSNEMQGFVNNRFNYEKYGGKNPDIRFDEGGLVGDVFTKKVYIIRLSGGDWFEDYNSVYDNYEDALNDYNKINNSDFERYENSKGLVKTLSEKTLKYKFVAEIDEDDNIDDYTDTITLKNETFWQIIDDGEWNDLEADSVERVNEKADKLLSEVYNYYGRKYNTIYLNEDETISLKLRIADHSGKWKNKGSEDYFLSIVISDKNPTEDFYMNSSEGLNREQEEVFSSENTFEEIIEFINEKIEYYKEKSNILFDDGGKIPKELYHYTSEKNFDRIFDSNILNPSQKYGNRLSFTSDSEYHKKEHGLDYGNTNVRITFDNEKLLSDGYSFSPFDHSLNQNKIGKEFEYVISTPIENVKKYIKNITIFEGNAILGYIDKNATDYANKYYLNSDIRYKQGGLIAPNGKPSNLTSEQYKLVRTKAFKNWFGDWENDSANASKVVDSNGEPLVVFHNSDNLFNVFDLSYFGKSDGGYAGVGFYFALQSIKGYGQYSYQCFLSIKNPLIRTSDNWKDNFMPYVWIPNRANELKEFTSIKNASAEWTNEAKKIGFDGFIDEGGEIVAFYPNQIKLADGSNTTFDSNNKDIRFDDGGEVKSDYIKRVKEAIKYVENSPNARMQIDFEDEEGSKQSINEGKDYERIFPLKSKSNSFIVKKIREGVQDKYDSIGIWNENKKPYDYKYPKNKKYGDKSKEFDTLQIANYDDKGKIVGIIKIATSENKKQDVKKGAFKISVRQDYQNKGIASKLIEKAESEGIDFVEALKNNNFTSKGRWYFKSWLNKKLKNKAKYKYSEGGMPKKEIFNSIGSAIGFGTIPIIEGHDMVAECDCGEKFTYQNSKKDILWQCPKCNVKKGF